MGAGLSAPFAFRLLPPTSATSVFLQALEASHPKAAFAVSWDGPSSEAAFAWAQGRFEPIRQQFGPSPPGVLEEEQQEEATVARADGPGAASRGIGGVEPSTEASTAAAPPWRRRADRHGEGVRRGRGPRAPAALSAAGREFAARLFSNPLSARELDHASLGAGLERLRVSVPPQSRLVFFGGFLRALSRLTELDLSGYDRYNFDALLHGENASGSVVGGAFGTFEQAPAGTALPCASSTDSPVPESVDGLTRLSLQWAPGEDLRVVSLPRRLVPSRSLSLARAGPLGAVASPDGLLFTGPEWIDVRSEELLVGVPSDDEALVWEFERPYREGDFTPPHIWGDDEAFRGSQRAAEDAAREFKRRAGTASRLRQLCFRGNYVSLLRLFPVPPEDPPASIAWLYGLVRLNVQALAGFSAHELESYRIYEGRRGVLGRQGAGDRGDERDTGDADARVPETWAQLDARVAHEAVARQAEADAREAAGIGTATTDAASTGTTQAASNAAPNAAALAEVAPPPHHAPPPRLPPISPAASGCYFVGFDSGDPLSVSLGPIAAGRRDGPPLSAFPRPPLAWHPVSDTAARDGVRLFVTRGWQRNESRPLEQDDGRGPGAGEIEEPRDHDMDAGADWWNED